MLLFICLLAFATFSSLVALEKSFRSSAQMFDNPQLWSARRLPCAGDEQITLPDQFVIFLSAPLTGRRIVNMNFVDLDFRSKSLIS